MFFLREQMIKALLEWMTNFIHFGHWLLSFVLAVSLDLTQKTDPNELQICLTTVKALKKTELSKPHSLINVLKS